MISMVHGFQPAMFDDTELLSRLSKLMRTSPEDFKAPGRAAERPQAASLNAFGGSGGFFVEGLMISMMLMEI